MCVLSVLSVCVCACNHSLPSVSLSFWSVFLIMSKSPERPGGVAAEAATGSSEGRQRSRSRSPARAGEGAGRGRRHCGPVHRGGVTEGRGTGQGNFQVREITDAKVAQGAAARQQAVEGAEVLPQLPA